MKQINLSKKSKGISLKESLVEVLNLVVDKRMLILLPQILWTGISISYYSGILAVIISGSISTES